MHKAATDFSALLRLLADPTRQRILGLLTREELSVGELTKAVGMSQSRVSNHLRLLREAGLLVERKDGASVFIRSTLSKPRAGREAEAEPSPEARLWSLVEIDLSSRPEHRADLVRLARIVADREDESKFFDHVAEAWDKFGVDFGTGQGRHRVAAHLLPREMTIADLGCGTGYFAEALVGRCRRLIGIDQSQPMLDAAQKRLSSLTNGITELEFRRGKLDALPLGSSEVDAVAAGMVLHHLANLDEVVGEMFRVLVPGGSAVIVELEPHGETWMREQLGDRHLGLPPADVLDALRRTGFVDVELDPLKDTYRPEHPEGHKVRLPMYLVSGRKPELTTE